MPSTTPFVDRATGELIGAQIVSEAIPLGKLIALFLVISLVPFGIALLMLGNSLLGAVFLVIAQFILAVGAGIVLMYTIARGIQLAAA